MGLANLNPAKSWMVGVAAVVVKITSDYRSFFGRRVVRFCSGFPRAANPETPLGVRTKELVRYRI
ncbi:MAG: hypothetical protein WBQ64_04315, partial [Terriglobales bacterium]